MYYTAYMGNSDHTSSQHLLVIYDASDDNKTVIMTFECSNVIT